MKGSYHRAILRNIEMRQGIPRHEMIERDRGIELERGMLMTGPRIDTTLCVADDGDTFEVYNEDV